MSKTDEIEDKEISELIKKMIPFMKAAKEVIKEPDKQYQFECPLCGGKAVGGMASINKHVHAHCTKCKIQIMQ